MGGPRTERLEIILLFPYEESMKQKTENYNLLVEDWIPVLWNNGQFGRVGIMEALTQAGHIRQIAASNPMDEVSILRLLLAVLQWCKPVLSDNERKILATIDGIPIDWLKEKMGTDDRPCPGFNLLGDNLRFFQDRLQSTEKLNRRVSDLFSYFPADTEINHFRHVDDRSIAFCRPCCAVGLSRMPVCTIQGGKGKSPSINNATPIYFVPSGNSLMKTFQLNWPLQGIANDDHPSWESSGQLDETETLEIKAMEGLTWQPRATWLGPLIQQTSRKCDRCGAEGPLISELVFKKGRSRSSDKREWRDPHVARATSNGQSRSTSVKKEDNVLRGPDPLKVWSGWASFWCETVRAIFESVGDHSSIISIEGVKQKRQNQIDFSVKCFESFTKQAKTFDEHRDEWVNPLSLLRNDLNDRVLMEIGRFTDTNLNKYLTEDKDSHGIKSTGVIIGANNQYRLSERLKSFLNELAETDTDENAEICVRRWRNDVHIIFQEVLDQICSLVTPGSPLHRLEAARRMRQSLKKAMDGMGTIDKKTPTSEAVRKPKQDRMNGGGT